METDHTDANHVLVSIGTALWSTDGSETFTIIGGEEFGYREGNASEALFADITGFIQFNSTTVIIADNENFCLRVFNRVTETTSALFGKCVKTRSLYRYELVFKPHSVIRDKMTATGIYVAESIMGTVMHMDLLTLITYRYLRSFGAASFHHGFAYNTIGFDFFTTGRHFIEKYDATTDSFSIIAGLLNTAGDEIGGLHEARFNYPTGLMVASYNVFLIVDNGNRKVKVLDLNAGLVATLCSDLVNSEFNLLQTCDCDHPRSLLVHNGSILIGDSTKIIALPGESSVHGRSIYRAY